MQQTDPNQTLKHWFYRLVKLCVFVGLATIFYAIYLDAWVQKRMTGAKWETPVKVYGRTLALYQNAYLPENELIAELKLLGYSASEQPDQPGRYAVQKNRVIVYSREFVHPQGYVLPKRIAVEFNQDFIAQVYQFEQEQWIQSSIEYLEPLLISQKSNTNNEVRDIINLATVPEWMVDTLLTVEDKNFYHHYGVSVTAIARAFIANLRAGRSVQGGSTLTQQLAKNLLLNDSRKSYLRKLKEALVALILDYRFSKDAILEAYFNEIYMGQNGKHGVHGFALGSKFYFNKPLTELEQHEFALLVGLVKGPSYYDPRRFAERAQQRRDLVLQLMVSDNVLTSEEYAYYINKPMSVIKSKPKSGARFPAYLQLVERELAQLELDDETENGLVVFTGLDPVLQEQQQRLFTDSIKKLEKRHKLKKSANGAVVSVSVEDGSVLSLVGDRNAYSYGFNRALDTDRNIGSLVKPAVYLTALKSDKYHLATPLSNQVVKMKNNKGQIWQPQNYDKTTSESVWLKDALVLSKNLPTIHLGMDIGLRSVINTLSELGVEQDIPNYPSVFLGAISMSPLDVAKWYQPIASFGQKYQVSAITSVADGEGVNIWQKEPVENSVIDYPTAYVLNHGLNQVTRQGTAKRLGAYYPKIQFAGKTGTTDDLRDSWFSGFDQNKLTTVWIGMDDNSPVGLTGSQGALSTFIDLQGARKAQSINVPKPNSVEMRAFDKESGEIFVKECGEFELMPIKALQVGKTRACPSIFDYFK